jgi:hypothetical protein
MASDQSVEYFTRRRNRARQPLKRPKQRQPDMNPRIFLPTGRQTFDLPRVVLSDTRQNAFVPPQSGSIAFLSPHPKQ